jgi:hypothetical protein
VSYGRIINRLHHIGDNYETERAPHPGYALTPLHAAQPVSMGQLPDAAPLPGRFSLANVTSRQVLLVLAVLVVVVLVMYYLNKSMKKTTKVERNAVVSRLSTKELAQRLYDRLESKGSRTNTTTMRSLERLSR